MIDSLTLSGQTKVLFNIIQRNLNAELRILSKYELG